MNRKKKTAPVVTNLFLLISFKTFNKFGSASKLGKSIPKGRLKAKYDLKEKNRILNVIRNNC